MRTFRFSLARVLELRQRDLEAAQLRVAALRNRRDALESEARRLESERRGAGTEILAKPTLTGRELASVGHYVIELDRRRRLSLAAARRIEVEEAAAVKAAVEARRKVRLLEIVKLKRRRAHQAAFDKEQEALTAELFLAGISRRANSTAPAHQIPPIESGPQPNQRRECE
jgi:flagellar export protein FliJ